MEKNKIPENEALTENNEVLEENAAQEAEAPELLEMKAEAPVADAPSEAAAAPATGDGALADQVMAVRDVKKTTIKQRILKVFTTTVTYLFLFAVAISVLFPFYWMIMSSLKSSHEYSYAVPATLYPTEGVHFDNYIKAFFMDPNYNPNAICDHIDLNNDYKCDLCREMTYPFYMTDSLGTLFLNTVYVGIVSTLLSVVITVLAAFAFARLEFKGKNTLFALLLSTMMIPGELFTITNYITVNDFGWLDSYVPTGNIFADVFGWATSFHAMIIPFLVSIFYIFLLRQNFMQIPNELYLAAKVDGTSDLKYLWKVMIPLAMPTLISITILKMMGAWNSYVWPRLVVMGNDIEGTTIIRSLVSNGLRTAFTNAETQTTDFPVQLAACTLVSIPLFLVFLFLRKYIMRGVARSGIKG